MVGRIRWVNISSPVNLKIFYDSFMTLNSCVKYVLKPQDGAGMCTPKVQGWQFLTATSHMTLGNSCAAAMQVPSAELVSIWLSLSAIKVHELKPGSTYLSKTLRAVKSLNHATAHLFLLCLEMRDPCAKPPHRTPHIHPMVPGAWLQSRRWSRWCNCNTPAWHGRVLPGSGRGNMDSENLGNRCVNLGDFSFLSPWSCRELLLHSTDEPETHGRRDEKTYKVQSVSLRCFMLSSATQARCEPGIQRGCWYKGAPVKTIEQKWLPGVSGHFRVLLLPWGRGKVLFPTAGYSWPGVGSSAVFCISSVADVVQWGWLKLLLCSQVNLPQIHNTVQRQEHLLCLFTWNHSLRSPVAFPSIYILGS